jgi:hypothetical protein
VGKDKEQKEEQEKLGRKYTELKRGRSNKTKGRKGVEKYEDRSKRRKTEKKRTGKRGNGNKQWCNKRRKRILNGKRRKNMNRVRRDRTGRE